MKTLLLLFTLGVLTAQQPDGAAINPPWTSAQVIHSEDLTRMIKEKIERHPCIRSGSR